MPICHKRKLAFCHVPRTGGVSICLGLELDVKDYHNPANYYRAQYPDYFLFATYRPFTERLISAANREKMKKSISAMMLKPNDYFLNVPVDCLLQFNNLEEDLNKMLIQLGHEPVKLVKIN